MEEGEEEQQDDNDIILDGACFNDTVMGEAEEEVAAEDEPADDLCQVIRDAQRECESEKEKNFCVYQWRLLRWCQNQRRTLVPWR